MILPLLPSSGGSTWQREHHAVSCQEQWGLLGHLPFLKHTSTLFCHFFDVKLRSIVIVIADNFFKLRMSIDVTQPVGGSTFWRTSCRQRSSWKKKALSPIVQGTSSTECILGTGLALFTQKRVWWSTAFVNRAKPLHLPFGGNPLKTKISEKYIDLFRLPYISSTIAHRQVRLHQHLDVILWLYVTFGGKGHLLSF